MFLKAAAPILLAALVAGSAHAQSGPTPGRPTILIHGNYCGPGNNAPLAPIDALDAACARHDACTPDAGLPSKACNLRLQADAERVADDSGQPEDLRMMAGIVASGAAMMPSNPSAPNAVIATSPVGSVAPRTVAKRLYQPHAMAIDPQ